MNVYGLDSGAIGILQLHRYDVLIIGRIGVICEDEIPWTIGLAQN
jgi:hypothetical protein